MADGVVRQVPAHPTPRGVPGGRSPRTLKPLPTLVPPSQMGLRSANGTHRHWCGNLIARP
jgi:hypothetical protein